MLHPGLCLVGDQVELIVSHVSLISRFWLSEARISYANWTLEQTITHYLNLLGQVLLPYATGKGSLPNKADLPD